MVDYDAFLELVKGRRSIRRFKPDPIPDESIDKIIEVARWAPSGANSQPWEFIVIKKKELKDKIVELFMENQARAVKMELSRESRLRHPYHEKPLTHIPGFAKAPVFILLCGDVRTKEAYPVSNTLEIGEADFVSSMANCFLYINMAACVLGLGGQWITTVALPFVKCQIKALLDIPEEIDIYDMMTIGHPDMEPKARFVRNRQEMVHYDCFDRTRYKTGAQVKDSIFSVYQERKH